VPYATDIYIEDEDSVALKQKKEMAIADKINVVVVLLPHISNYTDFNLLERDERVNLFYSTNTNEIEKADIIIIPGTKSTMSDLQFLRFKGIAKSILKAFDANKKVIGICGGYQMMGEELSDPFGVESDSNTIPGLGLLPIKTVLSKEKITVQREFTFKDFEGKCSGYEIHMGVSSSNQPSPLLHSAGGKEGYLLNDNCWGSYMHGIFDNQLIIDDLLGSISKKEFKSYETFKDENFNKLADLLRECLDIKKIYSQIAIE
jgi:adenosylcobyric acid synthase